MFIGHMTGILYKRITVDSICCYYNGQLVRMVDGYLGKLTTEHRMLIHLFDNILPSNQWAPVALTQAEYLLLLCTRKHVPRTRRLEKAKKYRLPIGMCLGKTRRKVLLDNYWKNKSKITR